MDIVYRPIGTIHTPFDEPEGIPIQGALRFDIEGTVTIFPEFTDGLKDIEGFSHLFLLYHFHRVRGYNLTARPFMDDTPRGIFSIRGPGRPNPVGMTVVRLLERSGGSLRIGGVDMVNGTPLLDIKPYFPDIDAHDRCRTGWAKNKFRLEGKSKKADDRFIRKSDRGSLHGEHSVR